MQAPTVGVGDATYVIRYVLRLQTMKTLEDTEFEVDTLSGLKLVKLSQEWCDMLAQLCR